LAESQVFYIIYKYFAACRKSLILSEKCSIYILLLLYFYFYIFTLLLLYILYFSMCFLMFGTTCINNGWLVCLWVRSWILRWHLFMTLWHLFPLCETYLSSFILQVMFASNSLLTNCLCHIIIEENSFSSASPCVYKFGYSLSHLAFQIPLLWILLLLSYALYFYLMRFQIYYFLYNAFWYFVLIATS